MRNRKAAAWICAAAMMLCGASGVMADEVILENGDVPAAADNGELSYDDEEAGELIVDDGTDVQISQGRSYEEVKQEEEEQEKARKELEELLNAQNLNIPAASASRLDVYLQELLAEPNPTGSDAEISVARYIEDQMSDFGYTISEQEFHEGELNEDGVDVPGINIIAERGASSVNHSDGIVVVTCHYDAASYGGVNDKSGAAVLLEAGDILSQFDTDVDLCFVFLSGEEDGWYGSQAFAQSIRDAEKERIRAVICLEDVGDGAELYLGTADGNMTKAGNYLAVSARLKELEAAAADDTETETETEGQTEIEIDVAPIGDQPAPWSFVEREEGAAVHFAENGMEAVSVFHDNPEQELLLEEDFPEEMSEEISEESLSEEALTEEITEAEEGQSQGEKLTRMTDILTTALLAYMQPARSEVTE